MAVAIKSRPKDPQKKLEPQKYPRNGFVSTEWLPFYGMVHHFPFGCHQPGVDSLRSRSGICWPWIQWKALHPMGKPKTWLNKFSHFLISLGNPYILSIHLKPIHLLLLERIACGTAIFWTFTLSMAPGPVPGIMDLYLFRCCKQTKKKQLKWDPRKLQRGALCLKVYCVGKCCAKFRRSQPTMPLKLMALAAGKSWFDLCHAGRGGFRQHNSLPCLLGGVSNVVMKPTRWHDVTWCDWYVLIMKIGNSMVALSISDHMA